MRRNLISLYGVQIATFLLPLLSLPVLARGLGPSALGELAAIQSLFATLGFLLEYGFNYSATRQIAIHREDRARLTTILSDVLGAKVLLSGLFFLLALGIYLFVPVFRAQGLLFWLGFLGALAQGFNLFWFYQGIEKLSWSASVDVGLKVGYTALVLLLVRSPEDVFLVIGLQALSSFLSLMINGARARQFVDRLRWSVEGSLEALREGRSLFFFRAVTLFYTSANSAMLRLFAPAATVAQYSNAERLTNVGFSAFGPLLQVFFPRLSHMVHHDLAEAKRFFRRSLWIILLLSVASAAVGYLLAPLAVGLLFGDQFADTVPLFRILLLNIPLLAVSNLFGLHWMVPNGMQKPFNLIVMLAAALNILSVLLIVPTYQAKGMAWGVVGCEFVVMTLMIASVLRSGASPFKHMGALVQS
ncbi:oligosaccharide flippase family protein [Deinococcus sp. NW-56]|uniref:oligosaccharide flippase family protein n=1 Tax=Deinococcus sp. NW-56 TaxID=2080419 RepID=UPI000CF3CBE7|nr:oligosaccharide flippase family protein [Deinococcus sp. NW-56]